MEEEGGNSFCSNSLLCWAKNYPLTKAVVHHDQKRVKAGGDREVSDEVTGELTEGKGAGGRDGGSGWSGGMGVCLILLASGTSSDICMDERSEAGPPEFCSD